MVFTYSPNVSWRRIRLFARFTHRLQGLFSSKQYSRLDGFDMTRRDNCEDGCRYSGLIGHLSDEHAIILAKRIVENQQSPSELLNERAENFFTVLWILGERRTSVRICTRLA